MEPEFCRQCGFFETRTKFCRANPPSVLQCEIDGRMVTTSRFPKISNPDLDYCGQWESANDTING